MPTPPATAETLDLETCFGTGRLATFRVDELRGVVPNTQVGDFVVVEREVTPSPGELFVTWTAGRFVLGEWVRRSGDKPCFGVVRGLVRVAPGKRRAD